MNKFSRRVLRRYLVAAAVENELLTRCLALAVENISEVPEELGRQKACIFHLHGWLARLLPQVGPGGGGRRGVSCGRGHLPLFKTRPPCVQERSALIN